MNTQTLEYQLSIIINLLKEILIEINVNHGCDKIRRTENERNSS